MKITKKYLKKIIKEELLKENTKLDLARSLNHYFNSRAGKYAEICREIQNGFLDPIKDKEKFLKRLRIAEEASKYYGEEFQKLIDLIIK